MLTLTNRDELRLNEDRMAGKRRRRQDKTGGFRPIDDQNDYPNTNDGNDE